MLEKLEDDDMRLYLRARIVEDCLIEKEMAVVTSDVWAKVSAIVSE